MKLLKEKFSKFIHWRVSLYLLIYQNFLIFSEYSRGTWEFLESLWKSPLGGKLGVSLVPCLTTSDKENSLPLYSDFVYGFQVLTKDELAVYKKPEWK